jgi:hypothetical protein
MSTLCRRAVPTVGHCITTNGSAQLSLITPRTQLLVCRVSEVLALGSQGQSSGGWLWEGGDAGVLAGHWLPSAGIKLH